MEGEGKWGVWEAFMWTMEWFMASVSCIEVGSSYNFKLVMISKSGNKRKFVAVLCEFTTIQNAKMSSGIY